MNDTTVLYEDCRLCGRRCGVNRNKGEVGFCGETAQMRIAGIYLHKGEEPPLTGAFGSGTVFFTGCTLQCGFCQNKQISRDGMGAVMAIGELADWFLKIQKAHGVNINLVTGTHFIPSIIKAIAMARDAGLSIPVVWNCSGFETEASLALLQPYVDIYLPDLKALDNTLALRLFGTDRYPTVVRKALILMSRAVGCAEYRTDVSGVELMTRGILIRHLVLPGEMDNTHEVLKFYSKHLKDTALLSLMVQYIPPECGKGAGIPERGVSEAEYVELLGFLDEFSIDEGFLQELEQESPWLPDFSQRNPFPEEYSQVLWHFTDRILGL